MARVFLSHSSRDNAAAAWMKQWLETQGFDVPFLDFDKHAGIPPGADWEKTLYRELTTCQAILILQTPNWEASRWCFAEYIQARALGKPILQVIESQEAGGLLPVASDLQRLDLGQNREQGLEQLRRVLEELALYRQGGFDWDPRRPPFPGLMAFEAEDAAVYFGRDQEIAALAERLTMVRTYGGPSLFVLLGDSGSGKSSLLRAGLLPRLAHGGRQWLPLDPMRPQSHPTQQLAQVLALGLGLGPDWDIQVLQPMLAAEAANRLPAWLAHVATDLRLKASAPEARLVLAIDQAEELFTLVEAEEMGRFLRILSAAMATDLPFTAVLTLRSEFLGRLQRAADLSVAFETMPLAPMPLARIAAVIEGPAQVAGLTVEPGFVQAALADCRTEDALPLLAFALRELYERFGKSRRFNLADYQSFGDVAAGLTPLENSVRRAADGVLAALQPTDRQLRALQEAFVPAMVRVNTQGDFVRRPASWNDLPPDAWPVLERLVEARLLVIRLRQPDGERMVEVAHEALLRKWPLLTGWLNGAKDFLVGHQQLEQGLRDWQQANKPASALLNGLMLSRAQHWLVERPQQMNADVRLFVQASLEADQSRQKRQRRRRKQVLVALMILSTVATIEAVTGIFKKWKLQNTVYDAQAITQLAIDPVQSMLNALALIGRIDPKEAFEITVKLTQATGLNSQIDSFATGQGAIWSNAQDSSGVGVTGGQDGTLRHWRTGLPAGPAVATGQGAVKNLLQLENDDLITAGTDGTLRRWRQNQPLGPPIPTGQGQVLSLIRLNNGDWLSGGLDGTVKFWRHGQAMGPAIQAQQGAVISLAQLPNGEVISGGREASLRRWREGKPLGPPLATGQGELVSLIGMTNGELVSGGRDGSLRRWRDGVPVGTVINAEQGEISLLVEMADGDLVSAGRDGSFRRWRAGKPVGSAIPSGQGALLSLDTFDSGEFITGGSDGTVRRWRLGDALGQPIKAGLGAVYALVELDNGVLVSGGSDGFLRFWLDGKPLGQPLATGQGRVLTLLARHNGLLASAGDDGTLRFWHQGRPHGAAIVTGQGKVRKLIERLNGDLVSAGSDGSLKRWRHGRQLGPTLQTGQGEILSLLELSNGQLVTGSRSGSLRFWQDGVAVGGPIATGQEAIWTLIQLSNGDVVSGGWDGSLRYWREGQPLGLPVTTGLGGVWSLSQRANGDLIIGGRDGRMAIWRQGKPVVAGFPTAQGTLWSLLELANGDLVSAGENGTLRIYYPTAKAVRMACQELKIHPILTNPTTPVGRAAAKTCRRYQALP